MLEQWAAAPEPARLALLRALQQENVFVDTNKHAFTRESGELTALGEAAQPQGATKAVRLTNRLRVLAATALATHQLTGDSVT
ncbi:MAG TPA: urea ABC transporter permease subunit UrtB, partial [Leclercia adecarboxylata]|nr:urea ABC transporter permease subunit UrtB [Leclercia adecarboxylata]